MGAHRLEETTVVLQGESMEHRRRRLEKSPMIEDQVQEPGTIYTPRAETSEATRNQATTSLLRYIRSSNLRPRETEGSRAFIQRTGQHRTETRANTPWGLWTTAGGHAKDVIVSQANITTILEEIRRTQLDMDIRQRDHTDFGRKAWI